MKVLLGVDFPDVYHPSLIPFCKRLSISVGHIQWDHGDAYICVNIAEINKWRADVDKSVRVIF